MFLIRKRRTCIYCCVQVLVNLFKGYTCKTRFYDFSKSKYMINIFIFISGEIFHENVTLRNHTIRKSELLKFSLKNYLH